MARSKDKPSQHSKRKSAPRRWPKLNRARPGNLWPHEKLLFPVILQDVSSNTDFLFLTVRILGSFLRKKSCKSSSDRQRITTTRGMTVWAPYGPFRVRSTPRESDLVKVLGEVAIMAEASEGATNLASLLRTNKVEALHATVYSGPVKFLVWTRLSEDNSSWIIKWVSRFYLSFSLRS